MFRELMQSIFSYDWNCSTKVSIAYVNLLGHILSANVTYLLPAFNALITSLVRFSEVETTGKTKQNRTEQNIITFPHDYLRTRRDCKDLNLIKLHQADETRRDEMRWDEMRWDEMRWDEMTWGVCRQTDEMKWDWYHHNKEMRTKLLWLRSENYSIIPMSDSDLMIDG